MKNSKVLAYLIAATLSFGAVHVAFAQAEDAAPAATEPAGATESPSEPDKPAPAAAEGEAEKAAEKPAEAAESEAEPKSAELPDDVSGLFSELLSAVTDGNWGLAIPLALLLLVGLLKLGREKLNLGVLKFMDSRWGKWATLFVMSGAGMLATAGLAGAGIGLSLVMKALLFAFSTAGVYNFWQDTKGAKS